MAHTGRVIATVDYHTAGEPFRIVTDGVPEIPGATVADRRGFARTSEMVELVRRLLCHEPRGHADMYGCFLVPPDDPGADLGVLFWHKDGYSTACGHGTIALGVWAVESRLVPATANGDCAVTIDVPSGRVQARVRCRDGLVESATFRNVPAFVIARDVPVRTSRGEVTVDVSYGGAIYVSVPAASVGLAVEPRHHQELTAIGREIKHALDGTDVARHPADDRLSGIYGTILFDDLADTPDGPRQRNVTVFADGEVDRSPCGSGTSARIALLAEDGRLEPGAKLTHDSLIGTTFTAWITETTAEGVVSEVEGMAYRTGEHRFTLDPRDPLGPGFLLR
jgi:proline racemase